MKPPIILTVDPRQPFVPTGLLVSPGERYRFSAVGLWKDWWRKCDADGWPGGVLQHFNRLPGERFFLLCACIGTDESTAFAIGKLRDWSAPDSVAALRDRQLNLFANDWRCMLFNNHALPPPEGPLTVTITHIV